VRGLQSAERARAASRGAAAANCSRQQQQQPHQAQPQRACLRQRRRREPLVRRAQRAQPRTQTSGWSAGACGCAGQCARGQPKGAAGAGAPRARKSGEQLRSWNSEGLSVCRLRPRAQRRESRQLQAPRQQAQQPPPELPRACFRQQQQQEQQHRKQPLRSKHPHQLRVAGCPRLRSQQRRQRRTWERPGSPMCPSKSAW
jgi:hypothetical protein